MGKQTNEMRIKKELALTLFLKTEMTQKEIGLKTSVPEKTISRWAQEDDWDSKKAAVSISRIEQLNSLNRIYNSYTKSADEFIQQGTPVPTNIADAINKISGSIEKLERDAGVGDMIQTLIALVKYVQHEDFEAAKVINKWGYIFIQEQMKRA